MSGRSLVARQVAFARSVLAGRPFSVLLQVTNRCSMHCSFCSFPSQAVPASEELRLHEYELVASQLSGMGTFLVSIEGGEPFLRDDLVEIVRGFSRDHLVALYTNGWHVTEEKAHQLFQAGLAQVGVSVDFPDARHDQERGVPGAFERALAAVDILRQAAPGGGRQVHMMSVLMEENADDAEALLWLSAEHGVGHVFTLLSQKGACRRTTSEARLPRPSTGARLLALWKKHRHWRFFRDYLEGMDDFLEGRAGTPCCAGVQEFNIDHLGNVSACLEHMDRPVGNVREEQLYVLHGKLVAQRAESGPCDECYTACRGFSQALVARRLRTWWELGTRMR